MLLGWGCSLDVVTKIKVLNSSRYGIIIINYCSNGVDSVYNFKYVSVLYLQCGRLQMKKTFPSNTLNKKGDHRNLSSVLLNNRKTIIKF